MTFISPSYQKDNFVDKSGTWLVIFIFQYFEYVVPLLCSPIASAERSTDDTGFLVDYCLLPDSFLRYISLTFDSFNIMYLGGLCANILRH